MTSDKPEVLYGGQTGITEYLTKKHEDADSVTMESVSSGGSVDTFVLNKKTGVFTNTSVVNGMGDVLPSSGWGNCD